MKIAMLYFFTLIVLLNSCITKDVPEVPHNNGNNNNQNNVDFNDLVWADEFNYTGSPNSQKWTFEIGNGTNGWGNNESEYYTDRPENVYVDTGYLRITAIREDYEGYEFTSARIITASKYQFTYGKVVISAKLPQGIGTWPALWMLGANIGSVGWPACGEIDIMEHVGKDQNRIFGTIHNAEHFGGSSIGGNTVISNVSSEFHEYSIKWTSQYIAFLVDNRQFFSYTISGSDPFDAPFFFIFNVAMGGGFGGEIDPNFQESSMFVDYIRVYQ